MNGFTIGQRLPGLNEYTRENRSNAYQGGKFKKNVEIIIDGYISIAISKGMLRSVENPVVVHFVWHERTRKRDADNIVFAKKFILDALVRKGILKDDSRRYVIGFRDDVIDDEKDYVTIQLVEENQ